MDLIVAVDQNWGIGKDNDLLYHIPEDMKFFRSMTIGKNVVCGKNTLLSFPGAKPLPDRRHFVLTHGKLPENDMLIAVPDLETLSQILNELPEDEVFLIGGESVYRQLYRKCRRAYVTRIFSDEKEADVFFPDLDQDPDFVLVTPGEVTESKNGLKFAFSVYENKAL